VLAPTTSWWMELITSLCLRYVILAGPVLRGEDGTHCGVWGKI
jgi:hypothetical protein